jgi:hypothetical protein
MEIIMNHKNTLRISTISKTLFGISTVLIFSCAYAMDPEKPGTPEPQLYKLMARRLEIAQRLTKNAQDKSTEYDLDLSKNFPQANVLLKQFIIESPTSLVKVGEQQVQTVLSQYIDHIEAFFTQAQKVRNTAYALLQKFSLALTNERAAAITNSITALAQHYFGTAAPLSPKLNEMQLESTYIAPIGIYFETEKKEEDQKKQLKKRLPAKILLRSSNSTCNTSPLETKYLKTLPKK